LKDSQKKARAGKWVRRIALGLLGLFGLIAALVAGGLIYLTSPAGGERLLSIALTSARKALRGDVQAERLEFGGNRLVVHQAKLFDPEGALVAEVETIDVRLSLLSLLRRTLDVRQLTLTAPRVHLVADDRGLNLSRAVEPRSPSPPQPEDKSSPSELELSLLLRDLALNGGAFRLEQVSENGRQELRLDGLEVRASGGYAIPSQNFTLKLKLEGQLDQPMRGPLNAKVTARGSGDSRTGQLALSLAGLRLDADVGMVKDNLWTKIDRLELPPELVAHWVPGYPLVVPLSVSGEAAKHENVVAAKLELQAGAASALVEGSVDIATVQSPGITVRARGVNLRELIADGPESALELAARVQGGGLPLQGLDGNLELVAPAGKLGSQSVGPVRLTARARHGVIEVSQLAADLPGLRLTGAGRGSTRELSISGRLTATNLEALSKMVGSLARQRPPNLSGSGELQFALKGPIKHPGVSFNGAFGKFRYDTYSVEKLSVAGTIPDIAKPLQSQLSLTAARVVAQDRTFRNLSVSLTTRGRDLEANIRSAGFAQLVLHATARVDADRNGLLLNALDVRYPEEQWSLQRPAHIRFPQGVLSAEPLELRSGVQSILVAGSLRKDQLKAEVRVQQLDLALLPKPLVDPALHLRGLLSAEVHADGRLPRPAVKARVNLQDGSFRQYGGLELRLDANYQRDRAVGMVDASGLGTRLRADFDVPIEALRARRREPVRLIASLEPTAIEQVLEALEIPEQISGTAAAKVELTGTADDPKLNLAIEGRSVRREKLPPVDLTLIAQSGDGGKLGSSLQWTAAGSKSSIVLRTPFTVAGLMQKPPTAASLQSTPVEIELDVNELPLGILHDAGVVEWRVEGKASVQGALRGSVKEPAGKVVLSLMAIAVGHAPPLDGSLIANTSADGIEVSANAQHGSQRVLDLNASLRIPPAKVQGIESVTNRPLSVKATIGPVAIEELRSLVPSTPSGEGEPIPPPAGTEQPASAAFDGVLRADLSITGSLAAPVVDLHGEIDQVTAEKVQLGIARLEYNYRQASSNLSVQLASAGGTLNLTGQAKLDLSYDAIRKGLAVASAPVDAALKASRFDLATLSGLTSTVRAIGGTLDADATIQGTVGAPRVRGKLEWNQGALTLAGFGQQQRIHLLVEGNDEEVHLRELLVHSVQGQAKISADARRSGRNLTLTGDVNLDKFPIVVSDQLVATLTTTSKLRGQISPELVDIHPLEVRQATIELPAQKGKDLQPLSLPDDVVLLRDGVPIHEKRYRKARAALAGLGGSGDQEEKDPSPTKKLQLMVAIDAPRNIWIKGSDLNIEIGLSDGFRFEYAQAPVMFGEVKLLQGRAEVLGRRFDVQKNSTVRFTGPPETPALDVTAVYNNEREKVKVFVTVHGQGKNVSLTTSSEPPLTETEIYTLIATGHRTLKAGSGSTSSGSQLAASALGTLAANQLKNVLAAKLPLDVLSIETGGEGGLTSTKVEAGTYVNDRVYIGYTVRTNARPELGENTNEVRLEYQISPRWYLEAAYGDAKAGSTDLLWSRDY